MKRIYYTVRVVGTQPFFLSTLLSVLIIFVILSDTVTTDSGTRLQIATKYLAWGTAFLSTILMAYSFRPEDSAHLEFQASLPEPFYRIVGGKILVCNFMIALPAFVAFTLIASVTEQASVARLGYGLTTIVANTVFFGSVAALGASLGRKSIVGAVIGLTSVVIFSLLPLPETIHPFLQSTHSASYGVSLMTQGGYTLLGALIFVANLCLLTNTDYLLTGKEPPVALSRKKVIGILQTKINQIAQTWLQPALYASGNILIGGIVYESFQWMINGWLPIMMGTITIILGILVLLDIDVLYHLATDFSRSIIMFSLLLLPPILCDSIPSDKRNYRTPMILACISPEVYLAIKVVGAWVAVMGTVIVSVAPFCILLGVYALSGSYQYLVANILVFLLAIAPLLIYISSLSVLLGSLASQRPAFAIGGLISLAAVITFAFTTNTILGNLFFPSGTMAIETVADWLRGQVATQATYLNVPKTIAPWHLLLVPLVSVVGQVAIAWQLALQLLKHKDE